MGDARGHRITITVELDGAIFQVSGKTIDFPGYLRAYVEGSDDPEAELADRHDVLPSVGVGEVLSCRGLESKSHTTKPPNRYSEASLTRALEAQEAGVIVAVADVEVRFTVGADVQYVAALIGELRARC